jgi:hypothetical protein
MIRARYLSPWTSTNTSISVSFYLEMGHGGGGLTLVIEESVYESLVDFISECFEFTFDLCLLACTPAFPIYPSPHNQFRIVSLVDNERGKKERKRGGDGLTELNSTQNSLFQLFRESRMKLPSLFTFVRVGCEI